MSNTVGLDTLECGVVPHCVLLSKQNIIQYGEYLMKLRKTNLYHYTLLIYVPINSGNRKL